MTVTYDTIVAGLAMGDAVNVFSYIPPSLQQQIINNTCTTDVTSYLVTAHAVAAGSDNFGGSIYYPPGTYPCSNVVYYPGQYIKGSGNQTTVLTKIGATSATAHSILVPYNYINNVAVNNQTGISLSDMQFSADSTSTNGFGVILFGSRDRVENCWFLGNTSGSFGGIHASTTMSNGISISSNINGASITGNSFKLLTLGALVAQSTAITAITTNVSITLNRATSGPPGVYSYMDLPADLPFIGTSNGTTTVLVTNTSGLSVGDQISGGDAIYDAVTDLYFFGKNTIDNCGSLDGTIFSIDSPSMDGWNIVGNKFNSAPGGVINAGLKCHSTNIEENLITAWFSNPTNGNNICVNLAVDVAARILVNGNIFKCKVQDTSKTYTMLNITNSELGQPLSGTNIVSNNNFDLATGLTNYTAFNVVSPSITGGIAIGNSFDYSLTTTQIGNGPQVWGPPYFYVSPGTPPTTPITGNGFIIYVDTVDNVLKAKSFAGNVTELALP